MSSGTSEMSERQECIEILSKTPIFGALETRQLEPVVDSATVRHFEANEHILRQGEPSDTFLVLIRGQVTICLERDGQVTELGRDEGPEVIGVVGQLLGEPRAASVIASSSVFALEFGANALQLMYDSIPGFGLAISKGLAYWLKQVSDQIPLSRHDASEPPPPQVVSLLPIAFLERHRVLPVSSEGNVLGLGFVDDPTPEVLGGAQQLLPGMEIRPVRIELRFFNDALRSCAGVQDLGSGEGAGEIVVTPGSPQLDQMIARMATEGASDLHLTAGRKPSWRIDGRIVEIGDAGVLGPEEVWRLFEGVIGEGREAEFREQHDVDFGYAAGDLARVRVNLYRELHGVSAAMRLISNKLMSFEQLGLPTSLADLADRPKGLVLVTGPTGSGKSTTLAAMIDYVNRRRAVHILTLEDPIEFVHVAHSAIITQREVGSHTVGFNRALRAALREDPDVILVGEMRDLETIHLALEAANTGHLVLSTLHTASAVSTVDRIVDMFPGDQQTQVRSSLAEVLLSVVSQALCRRRGGGRVAAVEVMVVNHAVANLIKEGKTQQIPNTMQTSRREGNRLLNDALAELVQKGIIEREEGLAAAVDKSDLERRLVRVG